MKRFLLGLIIMGGLALMAAPQASAQCVLGGLGKALKGNYAIRISGAVTDEEACYAGSTCPDPMPVPITGLGVIHADGACGISGGELILNDNYVWTSPTTFTLVGPPAIPAFSGSLSANILPGSEGAIPGGGSPGSGSFYFLNANNSGVLAILDAASGHFWEFGFAVEKSGEFRGSLISPGDPVIITGEPQAAIKSTAVFLNPIAVNFDSGSGGSSISSLGVGFDPVSVLVNQHFDPETGNTVMEGGGSIFFNVNNGWAFDLGIQAAPPTGGALVCDFHENYLTAPSTVDGTALTNAGLDSDWLCPLGGAAFENAAVLWGSSNQNAWLMTTGGNGIEDAGGGSLGAAGLAVSPGIAELTVANKAVKAVALAGVKAAVPADVTVTLVNNAAEPLDYDSIALSGLADVTMTTTCGVGPNNVPANNPLIGAPGGLPAGANTCTVTISDSVNQCTPTGNLACTASGKPWVCCSGKATGSCTGAEACTGGSSQSALDCTGLKAPYACCTKAGVGPTCGTGAPYACCTGAGAGATCAGEEAGVLTIANNDVVIAGQVLANPAKSISNTGASFPVTCK